MIQQHQLSTDALFVLTRLWEHGFAAYLVGGCVRDLLRGDKPHDWDIATAATPEQIHELFEQQTIQTQLGERFGTVLIKSNQTVLEVTTFRAESTYLDHRHPDSVHFTTNIKEDLARRDFTINAMAYSPQTGLVDPFGGMTDLQNGVIRCVGNARTRLQEDALRILRALRFAACLGFSIEMQTAQAIYAERLLLQQIAKPRIYTELTKLLCGKDAARMLIDYLSVLSVFIPALCDMAGFAQHHPYHCYDVLTHTAVVLSHTPPIPALRYAALLHDVAKPQTFCLDDRGIGHFFGHASIGATIAHNILKTLTADNDTVARTVQLVKFHDTPTAPDMVLIKKRLNRWGADTFLQLLKLQRADCLGQHPRVHHRLNDIEQVHVMAESLLAKKACFSRSSLAINGNDLIRHGLRGRQIGVALNLLLTQVMENQIPNEKTALLAALDTMVKNDIAMGKP